MSPVARILDGKAIAATIRAEIAAAAKRERLVPGLAVILVGENAASQVYVNSKEKAAKECGFHSIVDRLPADITQAQLLARIEELNRDPKVHGFFVQLPLPKQIDPDAVVRAIDPRKDVDGFHPENQGLLLLGTPRFVPATPRGVVEMLSRAGISPAGKRVVIVGRSTIVGKPLAAALLAKGERGDATVTVAHSRTTDLAAVCREADILIAAIGAPKFITRDMVKPGAIVIDVGINRVDGKLVGDVDFDGVKDVASAITPVPGGVGPMTIACLLQNTLDACRAQTR
ncbi:MAG TPA: bifunctional 5,10-methylenetetrahydrofolate dehydrogenase/5,10-methenyltetrahydrofolate cyclohydrolase [Candidatus Limnocylindrales bacterium]|nr:bifunctional 5,10-methylenetetrahydrofolate dehydrogenase/5,10-methenyltetrahydrofolate cyclohydrolase [Candidatus Limnocylindrales bacterium]